MMILIRGIGKSIDAVPTYDAFVLDFSTPAWPTSGNRNSLIDKMNA
jgi:hypothetical protein